MARLFVYLFGAYRLLVVVGPRFKVVDDDKIKQGGCNGLDRRFNDVSVSPA